MERLIDEIILKETEITQEYKKIIDTHMISENMSLEEVYCGNTELIEAVLKRHKEWVDYHNTIANTMRKYQKIKNIICKWEDGLFDDERLLDTEVLEMISGEVNGDGKDNN